MTIRYVVTDDTTGFGQSLPAVIQATICLTGPLSQRPAPNAVRGGVTYLAYDQNGGTLYRSDGVGWAQTGPGVNVPSTPGPQGPAGAAGADGAAGPAGPAGTASPPGTVVLFAGNTAPTGWLACEGASVANTAYPDLYAAIGAAYGSVDSTHFTLPDLRGRVPAGWNRGNSATDPDFGAIPGQTGGAKSAASAGHSHTINPHTHPSAAHTHTSAAHTHTTPAHAHTLSGANAYAQLSWTAGGLIAMLRATTAAAWTSTVKSVSAAAVPLNGDSTSQTGGIQLDGATDSGGSGTTGSTTPGVTGSTTPGSTGTDVGTLIQPAQDYTPTLQPYLVMLYIIKT